MRSARHVRMVVAGWVAAGLLGVLVLVDWPLVVGVGTKMQSGGDAGSFIWGFWWVRHALETGQDPLSTTMIFAPVGTPLALHTGMPGLAVASIPLQWLFGTTTAYNLVLLAAPPLGAAATYHLARDLGQPPASAFVAGVAFGFAPALIDRIAIEHLNLGMVVWLPLSLLALRRALARPGPWRAAALGAVAAAALYSDLTVAFMVALLLAGSLFRHAWCNRDRRLRAAAAVRILRLWPAAAIAALLAAPLLVAVGRVLATGDYLVVPGLGGATVFSADLASFLLPSPRHRWLGARVADLYLPLQGRPNDGVATLGFAILALAAVGLWSGRTRSAVRWSALMALAGVALAVGPQLHWAGWTFVPLGVGDSSAGPVSALLPFTWLRAVPFLSALRSPVRFVAIAALGLALLAGFGFARLTQSRSARAAVAAAVCTALVIGLESATAHSLLVPSTPPSVYAAVAADPGRFVVVNVPLGFRTGLETLGISRSGPLAWAPRHGRPVAAGFGSRTAGWRLDALGEIPLYRDLITLQGSDPNLGPNPGPDPRAGLVIPVPDPAEGRRSALDLDARYVVVDGAYPAVDAYLAEVGYLPAGRDGDVVLHVLDAAGQAAEGGG